MENNYIWYSKLCLICEKSNKKIRWYDGFDSKTGYYFYQIDYGWVKTDEKIKASQSSKKE